MASPFGKKLASGFANGTALGFVFYILTELVKTVGVNIDPVIGFAIGLGTSIGIALAKDEKEDTKE